MNEVNKEIQRKNDSVAHYFQTKQEQKEKIQIVTQMQIIPSLIIAVALIIAARMRSRQ